LWLGRCYEAFASVARTIGDARSESIPSGARVEPFAVNGGAAN
jgi:hypothetical protein